MEQRRINDRRQQKLAREPPSYPEEENVYPVYDYSGYNLNGSKQDQGIRGIENITSHQFTTVTTSGCPSCGARFVCNRCFVEFEIADAKREAELIMVKEVEREKKIEKAVKRTPYQMSSKRKVAMSKTLEAAPQTRGTKRKSETKTTNDDERASKRQV